MAKFLRSVFVLVVLAGIPIAAYYAVQATGPKASLPLSLIFIGLPGALGGLLYSMRERKVVLPHFAADDRNTLDPGFLSDIWFGLAGAYVVFLIVPGDFKLDPFAADPGSEEFWTFIKITGLAVVGGYGGRALVDKALADLSRKVEKFEKTQQQVEQRLTVSEEQQRHDNDAIALVTSQLDSGPTAPSHPVAKLAEVIGRASTAARQQIFMRARTFRNECWKSGIPFQLARTIPVFEALIELDRNEAIHRNHAQLGYALKDKEPPDFAEAKARLAQAISIRDTNGEDGYLFYEFNRALCNIHLDANFSNVSPAAASPQVRDEIVADLQRAADDPYIAGIIQKDDLVNRWLTVNNVNLRLP